MNYLISYVLIVISGVAEVKSMCKAVAYFRAAGQHYGKIHLSTTRGKCFGAYARNADKEAASKSFVA